MHNEIGFVLVGIPYSTRVYLLMCFLFDVVLYDQTLLPPLTEINCLYLGLCYQYLMI